MKLKLIRALMLGVFLLVPTVAHSQYIDWWLEEPDAVRRSVLDLFVIENGNFITMRCLGGYRTWCSTPPKGCPTPPGWSMYGTLLRKGPGMKTSRSNPEVTTNQAAYDVLKEVVPAEDWKKCTPKSGPDDWKVWRGR